MNTFPTYLNRTMIDAIRDAIRPHLKDGEQIIYRSAFRWLDDENCVMSNHYEMQSIEYLAEEFGYEIVHNFCHVAVIKRARP